MCPSKFFFLAACEVLMPALAPDISGLLPKEKWCHSLAAANEAGFMVLLVGVAEKKDLSDLVPRGT